MIKTISALLIILAISISAQTKQFRKLENQAFNVGEKLTFDVKYGFVTAGIAEMAIPDIKKILGRKTFHITFKVNTVSGFDALYKVRDRYESFLDVEALIPWRFEQHIREGGYSRDFSAYFDHRKNVARTSEGSYKIPDNVNDIISAFYLARTFKYDTLKIGDRFNLMNFYKDRVYELDVVFLGRETIDVEAGKFKCIMVEPLVRAGGLFKSEGNIIIWLSDDALKVPIKVKTKVIIGSIDAELIKYEGLNGKFSSKVK